MNSSSSSSITSKQFFEDLSALGNLKASSNHMNLEVYSNVLIKDPHHTKPQNTKLQISAYSLTSSFYASLPVLWNYSYTDKAIIYNKIEYIVESVQSYIDNHQIGDFDLNLLIERVGEALKGLKAFKRSDQANQEQWNLSDYTKQLSNALKIAKIYQREENYFYELGIHVKKERNELVLYKGDKRIAVLDDIRDGFQFLSLSLRDHYSTLNLRELSQRVRKLNENLKKFHEDQKFSKIMLENDLILKVKPDLLLLKKMNGTIVMDFDGENFHFPNFKSLGLMESLYIVPILNYYKLSITPLCRNFDSTFIHSLIEQGVDVNIKDKNNVSPLLFALQEDNTQLTEILLSSSQIDTKITDENGNTPLMIAVKNQSMPMIELLIKMKPECIKEFINHWDFNGDTPLMVATQLKNNQIIQFLIDYDAEISLPNENGESSLTLAFMSNDFQSVLKFLDKSPELINSFINSQNNEGNTPLMHALKQQEESTINLFMNSPCLDLSSDLDFSLVNNQNENILIIALKNGHIDWARKMLMTRIANKNHRLKLKTKDLDGNTAYTLAIQLNDQELVKLLFQKGRFDEIDNKFGQTPFDQAYFLGHYEMAKFIYQLVKESIGLMPNIQSTYIKNFFEESETFDEDKFKSCEESITPLMRATDLEEVKLLLLEGPGYIDLQDHNGNTALMHAIINGETEKCELLIAWKANLNISNHDGETAFSLAIKDNNKRIFMIMISENPEFFQEQNSLLFVALENNNSIIFSTLIALGYDILVPDETGKTLLMRAIEIGNANCIDIIIDALNNMDPRIKQNYLNARDHHDQSAISYSIKKENKDFLDLLEKNIEQLPELDLLAIREEREKEAKLINAILEDELQLMQDTANKVEEEVGNQKNSIFNE